MALAELRQVILLADLGSYERSRWAEQDLHHGKREHAHLFARAACEREFLLHILAGAWRCCY